MHLYEKFVSYSPLLISIFLNCFLLCSIFMWNRGYAVNLFEIFLLVENDSKLRSNVVLKAYTKL